MIRSRAGDRKREETTEAKNGSHVATRSLVLRPPCFYVSVASEASSFCPRAASVVEPEDQPHTSSTHLPDVSNNCGFKCHCNAPNFQIYLLSEF